MLGAILAGGYGKRLRPITDVIPKPLIEIKPNYTILDKQLLQFRYAGIKKVYLLVGYLHEKIQERYGERWNGLEIEYLIEKKPLGTAGALKNLIEMVDEDVVVRNGDIVCDINLKEMIRRHRKDMSMFVVPLVSPFGIVDISGKKIVRFIEKPKLNYWINGGIYIISKNIFHYFTKYNKGDLEKLVFPKLAKSGLINVYKEQCFWQSIDSIKDLEKVRKGFENRRDKPFGYERVIDTVTREIYVMKGEKVCFNPKKFGRVLHIERGVCEVKFGNEDIRLEKKDTLKIKPDEKFEVIAIKNVLIQERRERVI
jgi:NDP-sugar pyrophosphorylase family protein